MDGDPVYRDTRIEVECPFKDLSYERFVKWMISGHGRYEMLHREVMVSLDDTLFKEGLLVDETDGPQYQAVTVDLNGVRLPELYCMVPAVDVLWARARLEGMYGPAQMDRVLADDA